MGQEESMSGHIFLSYFRSKNQGLTEKLTDRHEAASFRIWLE
jgi:hypothetical protein